MSKIYDEHGDYQGSVDGQGRIHSSKGVFQGSVHRDGKIYDEYGNYWGSVWENGYIYSDRGKYIGHLYDNGELYSADGEYMGRIHNMDFLNRYASSGNKEYNSYENTKKESVSSVKGFSSSSVPMGDGNGGCLLMIIGGALLFSAVIAVLVFCGTMLMSAAQLICSPAIFLFISMSLLTVAIGQYFEGKKDLKLSRWKCFWGCNFGIFLLWVLMQILLDPEETLAENVLLFLVFAVLGALIAIVLATISYGVDKLVKDKLKLNREPRYKHIFLGITLVLTVIIAIVLGVSGVLESWFGNYESKSSSVKYTSEDNDSDDETVRNVVANKPIKVLNENEWDSDGYTYSVEEVDGDEAEEISVQRQDIETGEEESIYEFPSDANYYNFSLYENEIYYYKYIEDEDRKYFCSLSMDDGTESQMMRFGSMASAEKYYVDESGMYQLIMEEEGDAILYLLANYECKELMNITDMYCAGGDDTIYFEAAFYDHVLYYIDNQFNIAKISLDDLQKEIVFTPDNVEWDTPDPLWSLNVHDDYIVYQCNYNELRAYDMSTETEIVLGQGINELNYFNGEFYVEEESDDGLENICKVDAKTQESVLLGTINGYSPILTIYEDTIVLQYNLWEENSQGQTTVSLSLKPDDYEYNQNEIELLEE